MNLRHIEVFRAVMLSGSLSGASQILFISQPAVSKMISQIERSTNLKLFEKIKGRLSPTHEAIRLFREIQIFWQNIENLKNFTKNLANPDSEILKISASASLGAYLVPQTIGKLIKKNEKLKFKIDILIPSLMNDSISNMNTTIGVSIGALPHPKIRILNKLECGFSCLLRKDHKLSKHKTIKKDDLIGEKIISIASFNQYEKKLQNIYGDLIEKNNFSIEVRSSTSAIWYVHAGAGLAVIDNAAAAGAQSNDLISIPYETDEKIEIYIVSSTETPLSILQERFIEEFKSTFSESIKT